MSPVVRAECGTLQGALAHRAAGEDWCGWCLQAEALARLTAEAIPARPPRQPAAPVPAAHACPEITAEQAAANAALLDAEAAEFEPDWVPEPGGGRHLRRVA